MSRRARQHAVTGVLLAAAVALAGCTQDVPEPTSAPSATPTPLSRLNTAALHVPRADFCLAIPEDAVTEALNGSGTLRTWRDGEEAELGSTLSDVAHEFGCSWSVGKRMVSAWVFARPVDRATARLTLRSTRVTAGCTVRRTDFGDLGLHQSCTPEEGLSRVRNAGLFEDTWFTCELTDVLGDDGVTEADVEERADAWCVSVLNAVNAQK